MPPAPPRILHDAIVARSRHAAAAGLAYRLLRQRVTRSHPMLNWPLFWFMLVVLIVGVIYALGSGGDDE